MYAWQFMKALGVAERHGWTKFVPMQNHYNLIYRGEEREMLPLCRSEGIGVIPYSPLAGGKLTRRPEESTLRSETDEVMKKKYSAMADADRIIIDRAGELAEKRGVPRARIALAWLLHKPGVTAPIVGATKISHLENAVAALELELSPEEIAYLEQPYVPHPVVGPQ